MDIFVYVLKSFMSASFLDTDDEYASLSLEGDDVQCLEVLVSGSPLMFKQGLSNIHEKI